MTVGRLLPLIVALLVAGGTYAAVQTGRTLTDPTFLAWVLAGPVLVGLVAAVAGGRPVPAFAPPEAEREPAPPAEPPETAALRLLATLQEDGRLIDFLQEDVGPYSDDQIGAATRGIHGPCAKALRSCVTLEPVLPGTEGDEVTVPAGFDPATIRLVGNVGGTPPFRGVLRHAGWRVTKVALPERRGQNDRILAPAEVELA